MEHRQSNTSNKATNIQFTKNYKDDTIELGLRTPLVTIIRHLEVQCIIKEMRLL